MSHHVQDVFQAPFQLLGRIPVVLVPSLVASLVGLVLDLGLRGAVFRVAGWEAFLVSVIGEIVVLFSMAWVTLLLDQDMQGEKASLQETWAKLSERLSNVALAVFVISVIVALGAFAYIVPGILLASILLPAVPYAAKESTTFDKSVSSSFRFVFAQGHFWVVLLMVVVEFLLSLLPFVGLFFANLFITIWLPYFVLRYGNGRSPS